MMRCFNALFVLYVLCVTWKTWGVFFWIYYSAVSNLKVIVFPWETKGRRVEGGQRNKHQRPPSIRSSLVSLYEILNPRRLYESLFRGHEGEG